MDKKKSGGQTKNFTNQSNQTLWDIYYTYKLEEAQNNPKQLKTDPRTNIAQYKPGLLVLEKITNKPFADITATDLQTLEEYCNNNKGNHIPYVKAFLLTVITKGWIQLSNPEIALYLIPAEYKGLVLAVIEQSATIHNVAV